MDIGIGLPNPVPGAPGPLFVDWAQCAEERGFHALATIDLPRRLSRWLIRDLPHRIASVSDVPVTHDEGNAGPSL